VSTEDAYDNFEPGSQYTVEMKREKMRKTYYFRAWRIDVSNVMTTYPEKQDKSWASDKSGGKDGKMLQSHEVELDSISSILGGT